MSVYDLAPGEKTWPYHFELAQEEWALVVAGEPTLREPEGERRLRPGDLVCFPPGPDGAHQLRNDTEAPVRLALLSDSPTGADGCVYPDSDKLGVGGAGWTAGCRHRRRGRLLGRRMRPVANLFDVARQGRGRRPPGYALRTRGSARSSARRGSACPSTSCRRAEHLPVPLRVRRGGVAARARGRPVAAHPGGRGRSAPATSSASRPGPEGAHKVTNRARRRRRGSLMFSSARPGRRLRLSGQRQDRRLVPGPPPHGAARAAARLLGRRDGLEELSDLAPACAGDPVAAAGGGRQRGSARRRGDCSGAP